MSLSSGALRELDGNIESPFETKKWRPRVEIENACASPRAGAENALDDDEEESSSSQDDASWGRPPQLSTGFPDQALVAAPTAFTEPLLAALALGDARPVARRTKAKLFAFCGALFAECSHEHDAI
mmetsp:Transcript_22265/g.69697  ORF Transcript_22265/g.69697 Transcript_22265/m.69697 type:complete len:126 (+) Transcript_22265:61-438(+)